MTRTCSTATVVWRRLRGSLAYGAMAFLIFGLGMSALEATEYYVAVDHPNASDSNDGLSLDQPFLTLNRGLQAIRAGDTLSIKEGVYREAVEVRSGTASSPIVIRAYPGDEGKVVIRGSEVANGWTNDGGNVWSVSWQPLSLIEYPDSWPDFGAFSRRREMVFVDGNPLKQVLSQAELASSHFWMDDVAKRIRIHYSGDPNSSQVEIAVRDQGVEATGSYNVFRGLRVEHVANGFSNAAMHLGPNQRVEDCRVDFNNLNGIKAYSGFVFIRSTSNHNGMLGIGLNGHDSLLESSETSYNSWRFGPTWQAGGVKILSTVPPSGIRIVGHTVRYNNGRGIWFDTAGSGNVIEASLFEGNAFISLELEATAGPNWIINNVIVGTVKIGAISDANYDGGGIVLYEASDTFIYNNTIVDSSGAGIVIGGGVRDGYFSANTQIFNNIIVNSGSYAVHVGGRDQVREEPIVSSHQFDHNLYFGNPVAIRFPKATSLYSDEYWSLSEWQAERGQDINSLDASPEFTKPSSGDYTLQATSPAIDAGINLSEVTEDFSGWSRPQDFGHDIGAHECPLGGGCGSIIFSDSFESGDLRAW